MKRRVSATNGLCRPVILDDVSLNAKAMNGLYGRCRGAAPMPEKRRLSLSFSLTQREQRNAWSAWSAVAPGTAHGRRVQDDQRLYGTTGTAGGHSRRYPEELAGVSFPKTTTQQEQAGAVDEDVLGFLRALQEGDDTI